MRVIAISLFLAAAAVAQTPARQVETITTKAGPLKFTPIQHASVMLEAGGKVVYVDPAQGNFDGLPPADLILITDIHGDHMAPKIIAKIQKADTVILAPAAVAKTVTTATVIGYGDTKKVGAWTIEAVPAYNLKRGPSEGKLYHDKGRGNGYVVSYGGKRLYFSGDTENIPELASLKNIDIAFVCMNLPYTMTPEEAAAAVRVFKPKVVYPYHYGQTNLADFEKALDGSGIQVKLLNWYPK
jgi:L-ascorbate metabolism protein UlaG (beta-lactamase superfamily)